MLVKFKFFSVSAERNTKHLPVNIDARGISATLDKKHYRSHSQVHPQKAFFMTKAWFYISFHFTALHSTSFCIWEKRWMNCLKKYQDGWLEGYCCCRQDCVERKRKRVTGRGCIKCHKTAASENERSVGEHNKWEVNAILIFSCLDYCSHGQQSQFFLFSSLC